MEKKYYTSEKNVQILLALLKAHGIRKIIASPGATNVCFVGSCQSDSWFELYSSVDERSAAYMACGLAAESGEPVVLSCTGSTASRNYLPGLTEAYYRKLPVLAVTSHQGKDRIGQFFLSLLRVILLSFNYVLIKYTMEKKYVSPYVLGMLNGLINLILFIIFGILDYFFFHINKDYIEYFKNFNSKELLVILGLMGTQLGLYTSLFFIDKNESPCHIFIVFVFGQFGYIFINVKYMSGGTLAVIIISLILILFFSLVFNEIIELRFLGLAYNTKRNITERGEIEVGDTLLLNNNDADERSSSAIEMSDKASNSIE